MEEIDRLFKSRFENFAEKPPEMAWIKIESHLVGQKPNGKRNFWFSVAASLAALAIAAMLLYRQGTQTFSRVSIVGSNSGIDTGLEFLLPVPQQSKTISYAASINRPQVLQKPAKPEAESLVLELDISTGTSKMEPMEEDEYDPAIEQPSQGELLAEKNAEPQPSQTSLLQTSDRASMPAVVISYSRSKQVSSSADSLDFEKDNLIGKFLVAAQDIKSAEIGLSALRQIKDDLLERNLKKIEKKLKLN